MVSTFEVEPKQYLPAVVDTVELVRHTVVVATVEHKARIVEVCNVHKVEKPSVVGNNLRDLEDIRIEEQSREQWTCREMIVLHE